MNKLRTLKWPLLAMTMAFAVFSCSEDEKKPFVAAPTSDFTSATDADDFLTINFTNKSDRATSYAWDFGDGESSTEENPSHTYAETGDYEVKLTSKNAGGEVSSTHTRTVKFQLTNPALNGGSSKSWVIKPAAGSFGVGPAIGDLSWWPGTEDISGARPCLFNDEFIFKTEGVFEYDANSDIWAEDYMGYDADNKDKCQDESTLPSGNSAWGSGIHTYTFTPETDGSTPTIAVKGTGAFIALPKAKNGGEYASGPPTANAEVTYDIVNYTNTDGSEELTITINYGAGYWNFILVPKPL